MNEELKYIVDQVNSMFSSSYNMISFDSLSSTNLLQVLGDILMKLGIAEKIDANNNVNTAIVDILDALLTIKYAPPEDITPIAFREGISSGKRSIVYPILHWIFSNKEKVLKIKYLSTYMEKVSIPDEFMSDNEMQKLYSLYEQLIDEFWTVYSEQKKVQKQASEALELKKDIKKMETDTTKLRELVKKQKEKVSAIPNNAALMVLAKDYHDAVSEKSKLEEQLKDQQKAIDASEIEIKHLREQLQRKKSLQPKSDDPLHIIREELHINKILAESKLPDELKTLKKELELYTSVANEPEPSEQELGILKEEIESISKEVKALQRKIATTASDDQLGPFRNQAKIIANKKNELSDIVVRLKQENEIMDAQLAEKRNTLQSILGGPPMYGSELKQYIASVRERCNVYKDLRTQEQALRSEMSILTRTFEILLSLEPSIAKALEQRKESVGGDDGIDVPDDEVDLQTKCRFLTKEIGKKRGEVVEKKEAVMALRKEIESFVKEYTLSKQEFDDATGALSTKLEQDQTEISLLESSIKEQEKQYKALQQEIEKNETVLQNLTEEMLETAEGEAKTRPTQIDVVKEKLAAQRELNKKLKEELKVINAQTASREEQMEILRVIKKFLKCKLES